MIAQIGSKFISKFKIALLLLFIIVLFFSLPVSAQIPIAERLETAEKQFYPPGEPEENLDIIKSRSVEYTASNLRDPFLPAISLVKKEEPEMVEKVETVKPMISKMFSFSIQGIIWNPDNPLVIMNNKILKKGDIISIQDGGDIAEIIITDIEKDGVTVVYEDRAEKLPSPASLELDRIKGGKND